jgi:uncharacterized membrane protein
MDFLAGLHPKVVHFPIALLLTYILCELIGVIFKKDFFSKTAHLLLLLGVIGAVAAVLTGNLAFSAYQTWNDANRGLFNHHQTFANLSIWYFSGLLVFKTILVLKKKSNSSLKYLLLLFALFGCYLIYQTAEYGGDLVKKFGVGTELRIDNSGTND